MSDYCLSLTKAIVTYARYKVVSASNPGHLVLVEELLDEALGLRVPLHEDDVSGVHAQLQGGLVPRDLLVLQIKNSQHFDFKSFQHFVLKIS